ncbi:MAG TPA: biopolymer transporter [Desulfobacterales bacterium]|nr:biopolymer transporter [Desulfobacterales bacterium]
MQILALLQSFVFLVSSSLFAPVLAALAALAVWTVVRLGEFFSLWLERRKLARPPMDLVQRLAAGEDGLPVSRAVRSFRRRLLEIGAQDEVAVVNLVRTTERQFWRSLDPLKMAIRVGPGLGLIGTLIPMGAGLASLGQGDLSQLAGDLVVAFTTTVVGMAVGMAAYCMFTVQRRWIEEDVQHIELISEIEAQRQGGRA